MEPGLVAMINRPVGLTAGYACFTQLVKPAGTKHAIVTGTAIPRQRNECVKAMLASPELKWLLFVDDDQTYGPDALMQLLRAHRPIIGATIVGKYPNHEPWFFFVEDGNKLRRATCKEAAGSRVLEVGAVGTGFMLIRREVLEAVDEPWFEGGQLGSEGIGEDIHFCLKARAKGYRAFVDTGLKVGHLTVVSVILDDSGVPKYTFDRFMRRETIV